MVREVDPIKALEMVEAGAFLVDVREHFEFSAGRAEVATLIPMSSIPESLGRLPRDRTIVVVCRTGSRSLRAAAYLENQGLDAVNLAGGMRAWDKSDLEMVADDGIAPEVV